MEGLLLGVSFTEPPPRCPISGRGFRGGQERQRGRTSSRTRPGRPAPAGPAQEDAQEYGRAVRAGRWFVALAVPSGVGYLPQPRSSPGILVRLVQARRSLRRPGRQSVQRPVRLPDRRPGRRRKKRVGRKRPRNARPHPLPRRGHPAGGRPAGSGPPGVSGAFSFRSRSRTRKGRPGASAIAPAGWQTPEDERSAARSQAPRPASGGRLRREKADQSEQNRRRRHERAGRKHRYRHRKARRLHTSGRSGLLHSFTRSTGRKEAPTRSR